jgi:hypothetical protein
VDRTAAALRRAVALATRAVRGVAVLAAVTAVVVAVSWGLWIVRRPPTGANDWAARAAVIAVALVAPAVLALFLLGLRQLADLPRRARELPPDLRARVADVRATATDGRAGLVGAVVRLARVLFEARDALSPYAVISAVLRPALLVGAVVAAVVAVIEIPVALVCAAVLLAG